MIDEKHRHEIAEAMRRCNPKAFRWPILLAVAISQASDGGQDPLNELADLIDRPTCHVVKHETYYGSFGCEEAGELWTLSCGDECINDSDFPPSFCPDCGAMVVEKEEDNG